MPSAPVLSVWMQVFNFYQKQCSDLILGHTMRNKHVHFFVSVHFSVKLFVWAILHMWRWVRHLVRRSMCPRIIHWQIHNEGLSEKIDQISCLLVAFVLLTGTSFCFRNVLTILQHASQSSGTAMARLTAPK